MSTREIDLGVIGPGESARAQFQITNTGEGRIRWAIEEPPGWESSTGGGLTGECGAVPSRVDVVLSSLKVRPEAGDHPVEIRIASGRNSLVLQRTLAEGSWREALRIESDEGGRTLFLKFSLADAKSRPALEVEPRGIDLGDTEPVKELTRRIRISNAGAGVLRWQVSTSAGGQARVTAGTGRGRYLSLLNEALASGGPYTAPAHLKDALQTSGNWVVEKGYPKAAGPGCTMKLQIQGTGAVLYGKRASEEAVVRVSADERPAREMPLQESEGNRFEGSITEDLPEGPHSIQIQAGEGAVILEGVFVSDMRANQPPSAWARLTPLSGTTTRETDFVTIRMNLSELKAGIYTDHVTVTSNGGTARIPVSLNVTGDPVPKIQNVYRYTRGIRSALHGAAREGGLRVISAPTSVRGLPLDSTARGRRGPSSCTGGTTPPSEIITTPRSEAGAARILPVTSSKDPSATSPRSACPARGSSTGGSTRRQTSISSRRTPPARDRGKGVTASRGSWDSSCDDRVKINVNCCLTKSVKAFNKSSLQLESHVRL